MTSTHEIVGRTLPDLEVRPDRSQLKFFASVLGLNDPVYTDIDAAKAAGYPDLLIPPTFYFSLELQRDQPHSVLHEYGFDTREFLHGEETFTYHAQAFADDELVLSAQYTDYYEKKGGALKFIERTTTVTRGTALVAELKNLLVIRRLEMAS